MSAQELLDELRSLDIRFWSEDDQLFFKALQGQLTCELRESIRRHKAELLQLLNGTYAPPMAEGSRKGQAPLSFAQQRLWFLDQLEPGTNMYNIPTAFRIVGRLQVPAMQRALDRIVQRHQVLRTTFETKDEQPVQRLHSILNVPIEVEDLTSVPAPDREKLARRRLEREAARPFDLEEGPLLRVLLLRLDAGLHIVLLNTHHIISDGWSRALFNRELSQYYEAAVCSIQLKVPELCMQYADYSLRQHKQIHSTELKHQLDYWKSALAGLPGLDLATDKPRPAMLGNTGTKVRFELPSDLSDALTAISRRNGATPFMLLLAAFAVLLYRYSGQTDFAIGAPIAGRNQADVEELIGFFVNTLVIRVDLSGDPRFAEVLQRIRSVALDAYEHQDLPFERLVEELAPARDASRNPLFQVMFAFQNMPERPLELKGLDVTPFTFDWQNEKFDLSLTMSQGREGFVGHFSCNSNLFLTESIERMSQQYQLLLESIATGFERPIQELEMLPQHELQTLLIDWNATQSDYDQDLAIHNLIEHQVSRTPERTAVVFGDRRLSYRELNTKANQLAHYLRQYRVGPDQLVGLCLLPSLEMVVAMLGVLKAGGAYVPMDPTYPDDRVAFMLEDSGTSIVLTHSDASLPVIHPTVATICLDQDWAKIERQPPENPTPIVGGGNLAYMIYTSGSTGKPKGVLIEHRSVHNHTLGLRDRIYDDTFGHPLRNCLSGSISFDASVNGWITLSFGHELHVIAQDIRVDTCALIAYIREHRIDVFQSTPSQLALMLEEGLLQGEWVPQTLLIGGEAIDPAVWQRLAETERTTAYNLYGPTECTVDVAIAKIGRNSDTPVLGRPLTNSQIYLLDRYGNPSPQGGFGELWVGGDGLARGYHRRPKLTAERFKTKTLPRQEPQRLYRTGDFGCYRADGTLRFFGRRDGLVKLRGFAIELGEVEGVIAGISGILGAIAIIREDNPGDPRLTVYYRTDERGGISADVVRAYAQTQLPSYMVPSAFVCVEQFPLTPNGKLDRSQLPTPDPGSLPSQPQYSPPTSRLQKELADTWGGMLSINRVGIDDNFFELGGHSLMATRLVIRIRREYQVALPVRTIFDQPTLKGLAVEIEKLKKALDGYLADGEPQDVIRPLPRVARQDPNSDE